MDNNALLSARQGSVASRFVSSADLEAAQTRRQEEKRAAYARLGQEPPPQEDEAEVYDPRSLYERLQAQKDAKQEAFEDKIKLSNQFRGLDEEETSFLADVAEERREEERRKREAERAELDEFRKAAMARESSPPNPLALLSGQGASLSRPSGSPPSAAKAGSPPAAAKAGAIGAASAPSKAAKRKREGLAGIVRKKPAASTSTSTAPKAGAGAAKPGAAETSKTQAQARTAQPSSAKGAEGREGETKTEGSDVQGEAKRLKQTSA